MKREPLYCKVDEMGCQKPTCKLKGDLLAGRQVNLALFGGRFQRVNDPKMSLPWIPKFYRQLGRKA